MIFAAPWLLLALVGLPLLWWSLRAPPPPARVQSFPAVALLLGLVAREETPARTPPWLLALRLAAAALVIIGLAGPVLNPGVALPWHGPVLLVIDDGWAAAADWPARMAAVGATLDQAGRAGRSVALLTLAPAESGAPPSVRPALPVADLRPRLAALRPKPWPADRAAAAAALAAWTGPEDAVVYLPDGLASTPPPGAGQEPAAGAVPRDDPDQALADGLARIGPVWELRADRPAAMILRPPRAEADRLLARVERLPDVVADDARAPDAGDQMGTGEALAVLAQTGDGRTLARVPVELASDGGGLAGDATIVLPSELRNELARLVLDGAPTAAGTVLLDERWRRRPVGLLAGNAAGADAPLAGELFFLRAALGPDSELREGGVTQLLARSLSVIMLADRPVTDPDEARQLGDWVKRGGVLVRFAGPRLAALEADAADDPLLPVKLLAGDRRLGGALSWSQPVGLAPFPAGSPFAGLAVSAEVSVARQVLAEPSAELSGRVWASLVDGTPLVTAAPLGAGRIVLFHVTANGDWSNLPLSGLFVAMLRRIVDVSAGVAGPPADGVLAPAEVLDGFGQPSVPGPAARAVAAAALPTTLAGPAHPPGLYGPRSGRVALNLSAGLGALAVSAPVPGARVVALGGARRATAPGPLLLGVAAVLLLLDLVASLWLRGLLGARRVAVMVLLLGVLAAAGGGAMAAEPLSGEPRSGEPQSGEAPALTTRIGYMPSGDAAVDQVTEAGLLGLAEYIDRRTAAVISAPMRVRPGQDDLSFYPIIVWVVPAGATPLGAAASAALNDFMGHGGILLIDTRGDDTVLARVARGLLIPPLAPLTTDHVLARAFYLLDSFPGRLVGAPVWVARDGERDNDGVSPVVIGGNDWTAAWAADASGRPLVDDLQGGARQRSLAFRFGVNLVMYALTGNYKGDQVHVPAILERLGQ